MREPLDRFRTSFDQLRAFVEAEQFRGYDPYDALLASYDFSRLGAWGPVLAIQIQKRLPINLRKPLGIQKALNPKGIGLLLHAYALQYQSTGSEDVLQVMHVLFDEVLACASTGYSGYSWGYNFDWASPGKYLPAYTPSVVVSAFVGKGIRAYYECTQRPQALEVLQGIGLFIEQDLPRIENNQGICFSYTPQKQDCCYNASLLGAEILAALYVYTQESRYKTMVEEALNFVIAKQKGDGCWYYSENLQSGRERHQVDFHQGFILDSIHNCLRDTSISGNRYHDAINQGAAFYKHHQFTPGGRSLWRLPRKWPTDIHHQAQGIITFSRLVTLDESNLDFAKTIATWTITNMQHKQDGFFYFRKGRLLTNKIPYMRWGQAWMMLALSELMAVLLPCYPVGVEGQQTRNKLPQTTSLREV